MTQLLAEVRESYDFVVIDTPPAGGVSDALPLTRQTDGVVVVSRIDSSRRDLVRRFHDELESLQAPVLGVVANAVKSSSGSYYGYDYGAKYVAGNTDAQEPSGDDETAVTSGPRQ
jgi:succinoglycan biosynthesis transport protein ExoP